MKWLVKLLREKIKVLVVEQLQKQTVKEDLVQYLNKRVDIPRLEEAVEAELIAALYDAVMEQAVKAIDKI